MTVTMTTPAAARAATYVCVSPLCGSVASYQGTCCGQPMKPQGGSR